MNIKEKKSIKKSRTMKGQNFVRQVKSSGVALVYFFFSLSLCSFFLSIISCAIRLCTNEQVYLAL